METTGKSENGRFQILSLDGGGLKGLFQASFLAGWEEAKGRRITEYTYVARDEKEASQQTAVSLRLLEASGTMQTQRAATAVSANRKPGVVPNFCQLTERTWHRRVSSKC